MKLSYVRGSEQDGAEFWLKRVGWKPSEVAKEIAEKNNPSRTGIIADVGGGHGRETLWLAERGFRLLLVEPNKHSLRFAKKRTKNKKLDVYLVNAALPNLPVRSEIIDTVDFYWTLHQIPDEKKEESLKEIWRILKNHGYLYSASFGYWEGHEMPDTIYPILKESDFLNLHVSAGFKLCSRIVERSDTNMSYEKFWIGKFQRNQ
jgi:ubiquinone/menaquinone biosynthesis C-methylase UbiE